MHTSKTTSRAALTLASSLALVLILTVAFKWTVKAQEPPNVASVEALTHQEIGGGTSWSGDARVDGAGVYSVTSAGGDISGQADIFQYVYQPLNGNGEIVARVLGMGGTTNGSAKAGVMIRGTLDDNSQNIMMAMNLGNSLLFQYRETTGGGTETTIGSTNQAAPYWVKMVRLGNWLGGYSSADGINWTLSGWETINGLPLQVYVGLAVANCQTGTSCVAWFDQVSVGATDPSKAVYPLVGSGDGLLGSYYGNHHLFGTALTNRVDAEVNFDFDAALQGDGTALSAAEFAQRSAALLGKSNPRQFGVSWSGEIQAQFTEPYIFTADSDDGARVWLNEQLIINDWSDGSKVRASAPVNLVAGERYLIRIQYYQNHYGAHAKLKWSSPSTPICLVPQGQLYSQATDTDGNGLPDVWEMAHFGRLGVDLNADPDGDGASNVQEYLRHTDPINAQTWSVPDEWRHGVIGIRSIGDVDYSDGEFTITNSNLYIGNEADSFHYTYKPIGTNGQIVARLLGIGGTTNASARAGVMIRESLVHDSRDVFMSVGLNKNLSFQWREKAASGTFGMVGNTNQATPCWVKLVRSGDWVGGYSSADGTNWTLCSWEILNGFSSEVFVGLAAGSQTGPSCVAWFDQVSVGSADPSNVLFPVVGTGDGLTGSYYDNQQLSGTPVTNRVDARISFDWGMHAPISGVQSDHFSVAWSGEVQAQFTEPYTFTMESDDGARVWLNERLIIDQWEDSPHTSSATVNLTAGEHYLLHVEYYDYYSFAHALLKWSSPSTPKRYVPRSQLYSEVTDTDGNGLPDIWEELYFGKLGVDPNADPDGDGLTNLQEYLHQTNPLEADTDGDGIPDLWEINHGLNPTSNDAAADPDQDGLTNLQECELGTNPYNSDTDGDGLPDSLEVDYLGTDPTVSNTGLLTEAAAVNGAQGSVVMGSWQADGTDIYAVSRRGEVEFKLTTTTADKFLLQIKGAQNQSGSPHTTFNLMPSVDGESLGHRTLTAGYGTNGILDYLTPFLAAGTHTVRVFWDGAPSFSSLRIQQIRLLGIAGGDANSNGLKDWVDKALETESGMDTNMTLASYTSPVCLEGRDPYLSMMSLNSGVDYTNTVTVQHNAGLRWYANVPLSAQTNTDVKISHQNGGTVEKCSLQWLPVNALTSAGLTIRAGDSLLLTASDGATNSTAQITVANGAQTVATYSALPSSSFVPYPFTTSGMYTVAATVTSESGVAQTGSVTVKVIGHSFPSGPACWISRQRNWELSSVATQVVLEADSRLLAEQATALSNNVVQLSLTIDQNEPRYVISRLGDGGPVLDSVKADGLRIYSSGEAYIKILETYPDGSQLVEMLVVESPVLADVTIKISIKVGGVTFDDGTLEKILTAADLNALGEAPVRFIRAPGVQTSTCHRLFAYQGAALVGQR